MAQIGFFDLSERCAGRELKSDILVEINAVGPYGGFHTAQERFCRRPEALRKYQSERRQMMFKAMCIQPKVKRGDETCEARGNHVQKQCNWFGHEQHKSPVNFPMFLEETIRGFQ